MSSARIRILNDGTKIPTLAFGTGTALYHQPAANAVILAIKTGIKHIDTAEAYANEDSVGDGLAKIFKNQLRSSIFVTTKLRDIPRGGTVRDALKESLRKLKLDYVDLYLIHTPTPFVGRLGDVWKQLEEVKEEGLATSIGVSNFRIKDFEEFIDDAKIKPSVNQIELHPYVYETAAPLLEFHKKYDIATASYGGLTPLTRRPNGPVTPVLATIQRQIKSSTGRQVTDSQILSKWLQAKDSIIVTTSSKESRIKQALEIYDIPALTTEQVQAIDDAGDKTHYRQWMTHMDDN